MMFAKLHRRQRILSAICALLLAFLTLSSATAQAANSQPAFPSSEDGARSVAENTAAGANIGAPVGATDADNDALTYTLGGDDAASFTIVPSTGQLQTLAALNFEGKNSYSVTVSASDRKDATGNADTAIDATIDVTISVTNVDEPGTVILSPAQPRVGEVLRARVSDPDGVVVGSGIWGWLKSRDGTPDWSTVQNSAPYPSSYEVQAADLNFYLQATVSYVDGHGLGKSAVGVSQRVAAKAAAPQIHVEQLVSGLSIPWGIAFAPDGTMLFTERARKLSVRLADGTVRNVTADLSDVMVASEIGFMAIVVDPGFATNRRFYTCQGHTGDKVQVIAWTMNAGYTEATRVADPLVDGIPGSSRNHSGKHSGCRLRFGPDGYLWIATGDATTGSAPQSLTNLGGKVLRVVASTGAGAPGNPFSAPNSPLIYTYGHRNPQGLALRPGSSGQMWSVEHGPAFDDEINLLTAGGNYGWDPAPGYNESTPMTDLEKFPSAIEAKWASGNKSLAASGGIFLEGAWWGPWDGRLAVASLKDKTLRVLEFSPSGDLLSEISVSKLKTAYGRLRTPMMGPDDALYVSTSEGSGADKILRVTPQVAPRFPANTDTTWDTPENADITTIVATVAAEEPNGEAITYSLGGTDAASFNIKDPAVGELRANAPLDYETKSSYQVDVIATDPNSLSGKVTLTITVTNEDDAGAITLSSQAPVVGVDLTASVTDPDGGVSSIVWTWSKSSDQTTWTAIAGATSSTYRPVAADVGSYLRATAAYTDSQGSGKNAQQKTDAPVAAASIGVSVSETALTVAEGASATYTVVLDGQPASDVVIEVTSNNSDVTLDTDAAASGNQHRLTFTTANWNTAQTVTVAAADDADAVNDTASITHAVVASRSADEFDAVNIAGVAVAVTDDDTAGVTVSETTLTLDEGGSATYTVVLDTQPSVDVSIRIDNNNQDVKVDANATIPGLQPGMFFTPSNWNTPQTVMVSAAQDADAADDQAQLSHAVDYVDRSGGPYSRVVAAGVAVTVTDDETAGVTVSETTLTLDEGSSATYTVALNAQPAADVLIRIDLNNLDVGVDADAGRAGAQAFMLFTPGNWNTPQTVKVSAAQDADAADDQAQLGHAVSYTTDRSGPYNSVVAAGVAVTVIDDETAAVAVSETTLTVVEGASNTYTVKLDPQPSSDVVISVTASGNTDVTVSPARLTFTSSNWSTAQTVTVSAAHDADAVNDTASIAHAVVPAESADEYDTATIAGVAVTVADDDAGVTNSESTLVVAEGGSATYTVALTTQPSANVAIIIADDNPDVTADTDAATSGNQDRLTFTPANWSTPQTVTVAAAHDADAVNDKAQLRYTVSSDNASGPYSGLAAAGVAVTVTDDDTAGVTVSETTLTVAEGGSATYTVVLDAQPTSDVVINVTKSGSSDVTVSPATLTFTGDNWDTAQTVTVAAAHDADAADDAASITHAVAPAESADEYDTATIAGVAVTVDDDETAGVTVSRPRMRMDEGGSNTYTVALNAQPASDVVIAVTSNNSDVTVDTDAATSGSQNTLTFTPSNWSTAQTVTVAADQDADAANDKAAITHAVVAAQSADEYDSVTIARVRVTVVDDEIGTAGVRSSVSRLSVAEGGSATYTVVLDAQPEARVRVWIFLISDGNVSRTPSRLDFTPSNWSTAQTVTLSAAQDADTRISAAQISYFITCASRCRPYNNNTTYSNVVEVIVVDDEVVGVTLPETTLTVLEGGNRTYTVVLNRQPTSDVVINVTKSGSDDLTATPASLTFTTSNWSTPQTVTVRAAQDADAANDTASISHAVVAAQSANEYDAVSIAGVAVTVTDDETAGVTVSETTLTVAEGGSGAYTVVLDVQPTSDVVITVSSDNTDVTVSPATLTFTPSNWDTAQTVTVAAAQDADAVNDAASIAHAVDASRSANEYDAVTIAGVAVTVTDDDTAGVSVSETTLTVAEGGSGAYTVVLDVQPTSDVVINVTKSGSDDVTVSPATLTFTTANWSTAQTVTVAAAQDADAVNDAASITHAVVAASSANEFDLVTVAGVAVTVTDDETAGVTVSKSTLTVAEGGSGAYTVVLDALPTSDVVISVTRTGSSDVTLDTDTGTSGNQTTLTFTRANWDTAQTVTVAAAQDADAVNDAASITHAVVASRSADEFDAVNIAGVAVTVTDDETAGVTVSKSTLTVDEGGSGSYTVRLNLQPASDVVISVTRTGSSDVTVSPATLTFTRANWSTAQTVRVAAAQDADAVNDAASIAHAVVAAQSANEYDAVTIAGVTVTVADDDAGVTVSPATLRIPEGNSSTYTVVLDALPASDVVITVSSDNSDVTVSPATLTFTPSNWSTAKTVTVAAAQDADAVNDAASIAHAVDASRSANEYDAVTIAGVAVTVTDDDTAGVTVSVISVTAPEGDSGAYTVVLDVQPSSDVVISVTKSGSPDVTVSPATLTFTPSNWDTAQTVTVAAAQDADAVNDMASISHAVVAARSANEFDLVTVAGVTVTVDDDDTAGVTVYPTSYNTFEDTANAYNVKLDAQPSSDVVILVASTGSSDVTVDTDRRTPRNQNTLTFTPSNWSTVQRVWVVSAADDDAVNDMASITHEVVAAESADEYDSVMIVSFAVTVTDDETAGVTVSETTLTVAEGGSATYTVVLDAQPASDVVIGVTKTGSSDVTLDTDTGTSGNQTTLTFTPSNWDTAQTVTVAAAQDADAVDDAASIAHAVDAARSANEYDNVSIAGVAATVTDDDTAGVTVSASSVTVAEGGSATYTVVLNLQPTSDVVINVTKRGSPDVTVSPARLTFTTANWSTAQTVTVAAAQDADAVDDAAAIAHAVDDARSANEYDNVTIAGVAVTVTDDDTAGVSVSETTLTVDEGGRGSYTVRLNTQPTSDVVIGVTRSGSPDVTVSPATLTFSSSNWSTPQTVTVRAAQDADAVDDAASITHAVVASRSANEYDAVSIAGVAVTVTDDETAGVTVSETTLTVAEGGSGAYTVVLDVQPTSDVVINVTKSGSTDVTVSPATLTFTTSNWSTAQTVTVAAAQDADAVDDAASISHAVDASRSANEYDNVSIAGVAVTVTDDETAGVTVSETTLTVAEGGSGSYTVRLNTQPTSNVVINVTRTGSSDVTLDTDTGTSGNQTTLTFTTANWSTAQTVTVAAAQDADAVDDAASITHAVVASRSADEFDAVNIAGVAVTVTDDETAGVSVSETALTVAEGGSGSYTVRLNTQPISNVVISVTRTGSTDVTLDTDTGTSGNQTTLTFSPANWNTAQTVRVAAAQDDDAVNDTASIAHAVDASRSANEYDNVSIAGVAVTVTDDETAGVTVSETTLTVAEGGSATYTVVLDAQPTSDVVIGVTKTGSTDVTVSPATLTFTTSNWSTAQTVTVAAAEDADAVDDAASIAHAVDASRSANEYDAVTIAGVAVTVTDDDTAGVSVSETTLTVDEGGRGSYTVRLNTQPTSDVVIGVTRSGSPDVTVSPATLTFSSSNWSTPQTVTVRAAQDADAVDDAASITHAVVASRSANEYDAVSIAGVAVTVTDDETAGVTVSETTLTVAEGGSGSYTVRLNTQPTSNVVISVTKTGSTDVTLDTDTGTSGNQTTLTFTPANWSAAQTVTVRAAQDADAVNDAASITHAVVASRSADEFDAVNIAGVAVTVTDDETAGVTVSKSTLTVAEGGSGAYTVVLDALPTSDVVISVTRTGSSDVTLDTDTGTSGNQTTLTFTTANWSTAQTVTVAAAQDADAVDDAASITHAVVASRSADEFDAVNIAGVAVTVTDDETAGVSVSETALEVAEGGSGSYTVRLNTQPTSNVVISVTKTGSTDVTLDTDTGTSGNQTTLTFTPANWDTAQTVTVAAAQDADAVNDAASIAHAVDAARSANEYDNVMIASFAVTVTDDETAGVTVSETTLTVAEGGSATYTVVLDAQPTSDVVIGVTKTGSTDVTLDTDTGTSGNQTTLTFTPANWDTAQTVTVAAAQDADAVDDAAAIAHAVDDARSANEYDNVSIAGVAVTVTDDETAGVTVSETALTVDEGGSGSYTVRLNTQPTSNVVISVTKTGSTDVTLDTDTGTSGNQTTLTFTPANWSAAQTVTVRAAQDADAVNDAASITHAVVASRSADEFDAVNIAGVAVTVTDDETAGVTVSKSTLTVAEGGSGAYTVVLDALPTSDVVISVTRTGSSDVTLDTDTGTSGNQTTLTFTTANWSTAQTVTVAAAQDADAVDDAASITHAVVASRSANEFDAVNIAGVAVAVTDDETAGVSVSETALEVAEGGSGSYTVRLNTQPTSNVVIGVTKTGSTDVTLDTDTGTSGNQTTLTFTPANWDTAQTVTVAAAQDADAVNDAASIAHAVDAARSANEYDNVMIASFAVTVTDDETAGVTVSETTLTVAEGGSATYTVVLDAQPTSDVVIGVTKTGSTDVTVSPATLTFTTSNWSTAKTVTVAAAEDADAVDDAASIAHAVDAARSANEYDNVSIAGVAVTVTDDETAGVTVSETTLTVAEGGSATYTVVLNLQPTSDVVINVTKSGSTGVTVSPATLTFTTSNWSTAQTVTVAAAQDADAVDDAAAISHAVDASRSANEYDNVSIAGVTVAVDDDDTAGVTVSAATLTVAEGGSGTYTVTLNTQPASDVVINVTRSGSADVTSGNQTTLTFTPANWDTAQTVRVRAAQDADAANDAAAIAHAVVAAQSANEYDGVTVAGVTVTVTDDDTPPPTGGGSPPTGGGGPPDRSPTFASRTVDDQVYTVGEDVGTVSLPPALGGDGRLQYSLSPDLPEGLRFNSDRTITGTPGATFTRTRFTYTATDSDGDRVHLRFYITVSERPGVSVSAPTVTVTEGGSGTYTVKLNLQPTSDVVINVTRSGSADVTVSPATLTFTPGNWSTAQTVRVAAAQDDDAVNDTAAIAHAVVAAQSANEYDGVTVAGVTVTVTDDDTPPPTGGGSPPTGGGGPPDRSPTFASRTVDDQVYTVGEDVGTVSLPPALGGDGRLQYSLSPDLPEGLRFNSDRTITGTPGATFTRTRFTYTATDSDGDRVHLRFYITVSERPGVSVSAPTVTVTEGGSGTYTVKLNLQPTSDVVINVTRSGSSDVTVSPARLTFTTANWSTAQTVTVAAAQDADAVDDAASITHAVVASRSADEFDAVNIAGVAVAVTDDETAGVSVSETALTVDEGGSGSYTVRLNTQPTSNVVISVTKTGSTDVTLDTDTGTSGNQTTLTFTPANWDTAQTVRVRAAQDADAANDAAAIAHAVVAAQSANEYDGVTVAGVTVTVTDDDTPPPTGGGSPPTGGGGPPDRSPTFASRTVDDQVYTVGEDVGTVSLPPALGGDGRLQYSLSPDLPEGLRFNSDRTITGTPGATFTRTRFTYTATDSDGDRVHLRFYITVSERPGVSVSAPTVTVTEGGSGTYTVKLNLQPTSDVVINVTRSGSADVTVSPATLTFTPGNWSTAQTVRVAAAQDDDAVNDTAAIAHAVVAAQSANEYDGVTVAGVTVTVTDDDTPPPTGGGSPPTGGGGPPDRSPTFASRTVDDQVYTVGEDVGTVSLPPALGGDGRLQYSLSPDLPEGLRFNSDRTITGTPGATFTRTRFTYTATDSDGDRVHLRFYITVSERPGVSVSAPTVTVTEGGSGTYTVKLNLQPTSDVVINVTRSGSSDVTVSPARLTFTTANWSTAQTVTVAAAQDADAVDDAASITHAVVASRSADEFDAVNIAGVAVAVTDDETAGVSVSETALTVDEGGSGSYTVRLNTQPTSNVVISVTKTGSTDVTLDTDTGTSGNQTTLTFTPANWDTAQTVRVRAAQDADAANDAAAIAHAVVAAQSANEYDGVTVAGVTVTVTDDDTPPPTGGGSPPTGGGGPPDRSPTFASRTVDDQVYTVGEDVGTVSLPPALGGDGRLQYSLSPDLPEGLRFNSDRTITGTPGATFTRTRFTYTATDSDGDRVHLRFYITVSERPGVSVSAPTVTVTEGGSGTYTVKLNLQPTSDVVINVTRSGSADVTVSPATLTFTPGNWSTAQTVRVAAAQDDDAVNDTAAIAHAVVAAQSANEYDGVTVAGVTVTVTDDETAGVTVSPTNVTADEGGNIPSAWVLALIGVLLNLVAIGVAIGIRRRH